MPLSPSKALATLENDVSELIASGMVTLNAKLNGIDDEKLIARVGEIWGFFWDQVLTYLEGVRLLFIVAVVPSPNSIAGAFTVTNGSLIAVIVSDAEISQDDLSKSTE